MIFIVAGAVIVAVTTKSFRAYMRVHPYLIRILGLSILGLGIGSCALMMHLYRDPSAVPRVLEAALVGLILSGGLIAYIPNMIRKVDSSNKIVLPPGSI
jgi:hypothetical protein